MLRQSTAPKPAPKPKEAPVPKPVEVIEPLPPTEPVVPEPEPEPQVEEPPAPTEAPVEQPEPTEIVKIIEPEVALPPPEDDLTKGNLDLLPDESHPPTTATAASTAADSWDARQLAQPSAAVTPLSASQAQHQAARPAASGYAATALKATERPPARMPSYQRRLLEQEEAVRMPGNREVDRAAVQFGAFSLNGAEDDIDGDREDPETRTQPPAESPAAPRASLPPIAQPTSVPDSFPSAQKPTTSQPQAPSAAGISPRPPSEKNHRTHCVLVTPVAPPTGPASSVVQRMFPPPPPRWRPQLIILQRHKRRQVISLMPDSLRQAVMSLPGFPRNPTILLVNSQQLPHQALTASQLLRPKLQGLKPVLPSALGPLSILLTTLQINKPGTHTADTMATASSKVDRTMANPTLLVAHSPPTMPPKVIT